MRMPDQPNNLLLSSCGMNCLICSQYLKWKNPCPGCNSGDNNKPLHCRTCAILQCAREKTVEYCFLCAEFPCLKLKNLDRSYRRRYGVSLIDDSRTAEKTGISALMENQKKQWICSICGGVVSVHDRICSECGQKRE